MTRRAVATADDFEPQTKPDRSPAVIRAELRELAELHIPADALPWFKERFGNVWVRPMRQLEMFR